MLFEALIPISMFVGLFTMIIVTTYINRTAMHKERMAMIENGIDPDMFDKKKRKRKEKGLKKKNNHRSLKYGMLAVGLGLGLIVGTILNIFLRIEPLPQFAMMLVFGGGALISYYNIMAKREAEERDRIDFDTSEFKGDELV